MKIRHFILGIIVFIMPISILFASNANEVVMSEIDLFEDGFDPLLEENIDYSMTMLFNPTAINTTMNPPCLQTSTSISGSTFGSGNNCPNRTTNDYIVEVNIPFDGNWTFTTCSANTNYDTYIYVGTTCCGNEVGQNDDLGAACSFSGFQSGVTSNLTAGTYYVAVEGFNGNGNFELIVTLNTPTPWDTEAFGNNEWLVYGYGGNNYSPIRGFYNAGTSLSQATTSHFGVGSNPSTAPSWQGCSINNDNHSYRYKRKGFPCGVYQLDIGNHDDYAYVEIDGTTVWFLNGCCTSHTNVWTGVLDANSEVLIGLREFGGASELRFNFIDVTTPLNAGSHNTTTINGCEGYNPPTINSSSAASGGVSAAVTDGTSTYQWQLNGVDIGGATGLSYNPPALGVGTHVYRREVTDRCGNVAYTNTKTYNLVADPTITLTSAATICPGESHDLTATTSGGAGTCTFVWQSSPNNSTWTTLVTNTSNTYTTEPLNSNTYFRVRRNCTGAGCNDPYSTSVLVTVEDNTPPVPTCPASITVNNTVGDCEANVTWTTPTFTDNCFPATLNSGGFSFSHIGNYEGHAYYYSDTPLVPAGSSDADQQAAFAQAQSIAVDLGGYLATVNDVAENTFINNNTAANVLIGYTDEAVEGSFGWIGSCCNGAGSGYTNWNGGEPNNVGGEDYTEIQSGAGGWNDIDLFNSNRRFLIEINVLTSTHDSGDVFPVGTTAVTYTATDPSGNTSTCSFNVIVNDTENPVAVCPTTALSVTLDGSGNGNLAANALAGGNSTDNCSVTESSPATTFTCADVGVQTVVLTATDASGNTSTVNCNVTVIDNQVPLITCPTNVNVSNDLNVCTATVNSIAPTITENCPTTIAYNVTGATTTSGTTDASGTAFNIGVSTVQYIVDDNNGNTASCSFTVTVNDNQPPSFTTCPSTQNVANDVNSCGAIVNGLASVASDDCGTVTTNYTLTGVTTGSGTSSDISGTFFNIGTTTVTYVADDGNGNSATCYFDVVVTDAQGPSLSACPSSINTSVVGSSCAATVVWAPPTANDNCPGVNLTSTHNSGDSFPEGVTTVIYTATDVAGNSSTCSFDVTVVDNNPPTVSCQDASLSLDALGNASISSSSLVTSGFNDDCGFGSVTYNPSAFTCADIGVVTVMVTVTDINGNTATCNSNVTITDPLSACCDLNINSISTVDGSCSGSSGQATINATCTNCTGTLLYSIDGVAFQPSNVFTGLAAGGYVATVKDASTCLDTDAFVIGGGGSGPPITFTAPADICLSEPSLTNLSGGSPTQGSSSGDSGVYAGNGVTDNGNGTYNFDPMAAGIGTHTITYTYDDGAGCIGSASDAIDVLAAPIAALTCPAPIENECSGLFNCSPQELTGAPLGTLTGSFSGSALPYVSGSGVPGEDAFIDFTIMPVDTPFELIYTVTSTSGCSSSASCTFQVSTKKANAGKY